jgi:16S rRNA (uracil1498-N3)-methyltransferase
MRRSAVQSRSDPPILMHRFYDEHADFSKPSFSITDRDEIHHMRDVLRLKAGDEVCIFNGRNEQARAKITLIDAARVAVNIQSVDKVQEAGAVNIILACAVPKKAKFEYIIEKCTELGVGEIMPLKTARSEVFFSAEKMGAKQARFQKVAVNAAKQSGRLQIPKVYPMMPLSEALRKCTVGTLAIFPSLVGQPPHIRTIMGQAKQVSQIIIFIGPEGDFTPEENRMAQQHGCHPVSLGATVLKVDTAAIASVAFARFLFLA